MEEKFDKIVKNLTFSIHNIEVQLGQLVNIVDAKVQGNLLGMTEANPKEVKTITLRSDKVVNSQVEVFKKVETKE